MVVVEVAMVLQQNLQDMEHLPPQNLTVGMELHKHHKVTVDMELPKNQATVGVVAREDLAFLTLAE